MISLDRLLRGKMTILKGRHSTTGFILPEIRSH